MKLYDAHNHLQDERLASHRPNILTTLSQEPIVCMVVNGSSEGDWPEVAALAEAYPFVLPSFGYHPWYVKDRSPDWQTHLTRWLDKIPSAVGEIGLDRWIANYDIELQEDTFVRQLQIAAERELPVSIHCLKTWGRLLELLRAGPRPRCGFLLHSFGGPRELIPELAHLGAYFSLPGYFAHERKARQRDSFRHVPLDRLLIETDAPDQLLPAARNRHPLADPRTHQPLNHPANLSQVYQFASELLDTELPVLADQVAQNFRRLFGPLADAEARNGS